MAGRVMRALREALARPFREAAGINAAVLVSTLRGLEGRFLELGPGTAPLLERLERVPVEQKTVLELPAAIGHCRALGYRCLAQDIGGERWDLPNQSMDVIVANQVLEHIPRTDHVLRECARVLRPGGSLLLSVPNPGALAYIAMLLLTLQPPMSMVSDEYYGLGNPLSSRRGQPSAERGTSGHGHLRLFTPRGMTDLLAVHGFDVVSHDGGTWGVPLLGRALARAFPWYGLLTITLAKRRFP